MIVYFVEVASFHFSLMLFVWGLFEKVGFCSFSGLIMIVSFVEVASFQLFSDALGMGIDILGFRRKNETEEQKIHMDV